MRLLAKLILLAGAAQRLQSLPTRCCPRASSKRQCRPDHERTVHRCPCNAYDASAGLAMRAPKSIPDAMHVARYAACIRRAPRVGLRKSFFRDGAFHFFDSPIDLFVFLQRMDRTNKRYVQKDIAVS